jgi:hypothetical protein
LTRSARLKRLIYRSVPVVLDATKWACVRINAFWPVMQASQKFRSVIPKERDSILLLSMMTEFALYRLGELPRPNILIPESNSGGTA